MIKRTMITTLAIALLVAMIISGCKKSDSPTSTTATTQTFGADLTRADFEVVLGTMGGDPRGTYTPNTPFMQVFHTNSAFTITDVAGGTNTGTGTIKFEGSSATSGTYTTSSMSINVNFDVTLTHQGQSQNVPIAPSLGSINGSISGGTWQTVGTDKIVLNDNKPGETPDTLQYATSSKGFFFGTEEETSDGTIIIVGAFKK